MINAILDGILHFIVRILDLIVSPLDNLILAIFPNIATIINSVNTFIDDITGYLVYVLDILPISFLNILILICDIELLYLGASTSYYLLVRLFRVIRNIKFW